MNTHNMHDAADDLLHDIDEHDRNRPERDSVEDRTGAAVMRRNGASESFIIKVFGYSPTPYSDIELRTK